VPKNNKEFNVGQPVEGLKTDRVFDNPEVKIRFKCDVHIDGIRLLSSAAGSRKRERGG
jgi:hypothetical protein